MVCGNSIQNETSRQHQLSTICTERAPVLELHLDQSRVFRVLLGMTQQRICYLFYQRGHTPPVPAPHSEWSSGKERGSLIPGDTSPSPKTGTSTATPGGRPEMSDINHTAIPTSQPTLHRCRLPIHTHQHLNTHQANPNAAIQGPPADYFLCFLPGVDPMTSEDFSLRGKELNHRVTYFGIKDFFL